MDGPPRPGAKESLVRSKQSAQRTSQSLVEFAVVAPLFFLLIMGIVDFGRLFYVQATLQHAMREAGRFAVTGNHLPDPQNPGQNLSRMNSIIEVTRKAAAGLDVSNIQVSSQNGGGGSAGGPGDTVTVSMQCGVHLITPIVAQFFPAGTYTFRVSTSFRNEPFDPSNTN
jgi:Flp pilus assembly protein TadG